MVQVSSYTYCLGADFSFPFLSGDVLEILEQRHDWAKMSFTLELFKYVFTVFLPEVIVHSQSQDEEQVRGHYDRMWRHIFLYSIVVVNMAPM